MSGLQLAHFFTLALWGGLVAGEMVMEIVSRRDEALGKAAAKFHYWFDLCVEGPLLMGVLVTGGLLLRGRELDTLLVVKVAAGLGAVLANLYCVGVVIRRARTQSEPERMRLTTRVFLS